MLGCGVLSYYIYWRIGAAEFGGRARIRLLAGPVLNVLFWLFVAFVAIGSGASSASHEDIMRLPFGLSIF